MKHHIEKNTVQETLVIPLYARKRCTELFPQLYRDDDAARLMDRIDYDFAEYAKNTSGVFYEFGFLEVAMRQTDLAWEVCDYLCEHPRAAVVNLGCGLDGTGRACDNGQCLIYNIDLPGVIELRDELLPAGERELNLAADLKDTSWFDAIDASGGAVFFASGVFYYFLHDEVRALVCAMAERFPGGRLVFDGCGKAGVKMLLKTWIKEAQIKDVGAYFAVSDAAAELGPWSDRLRVSSRGYMLGYQSLNVPGVSALHRLLARVGDNLMKMQIVRVEFV